MPDNAPLEATDLTIECEVLIDAPIEVVWRTITEPDQIAKWFADEAHVELRANGPGVLVFEDKETGQSTRAALVVATVEPPRRFSFRWGHPEGEVPAAGNSALVEFALSAEGSDRTRLRVTETGLDATPWPQDEKERYVEDHRRGWAHHLGRLEVLLAADA